MRYDVNRDTCLPGQKTESPYFYGPFGDFQPIETYGFASSSWLQHSENLLNILQARRRHRSPAQWIRKGLKCLLNMEWRSILPREVEKLLCTERKFVLDIGGGWGDNYLQLKRDGILPRENIRYAVMDNEEQQKLGSGPIKSLALEAIG